ncbi:DUF4843 domain-containing protein [Pedobacter metabolipauper]|nr:DUF4843 domain-containing protein [Pedobacter metabolipauper]
MKLIIKKGLLMLAAGLLFASCTKDKDLLFNEPTAIYVVALPDSVDFSFATTPTSVISDTLFMTYRIIGNAAPQDRTINLVARDGATAKAGYHYKLGPAVVKAGEFAAEVPVYVYRKAGLKDSTVQVIFDIKENADFKTGFPTRLRYKLTLTDILQKPSNWETTWKTYFGEYSEVKFRFLLSVTGRTVWTGAVYPGDSRFLAGRARNALLEYNQTYGALIDENGVEVSFP